jgi:hypothetical protein
MFVSKPCLVQPGMVAGDAEAHAGHADAAATRDAWVRCVNAASLKRPRGKTKSDGRPKPTRASSFGPSFSHAGQALGAGCISR